MTTYQNNDKPQDPRKNKRYLAEKNLRDIFFENFLKTFYLTKNDQIDQVIDQRNDQIDQVIDQGNDQIDQAINQENDQIDQTIDQGNDQIQI